MGRIFTGTVALFTQNLAASGANQVLLNIIKGGLFDGNIVLVSPKDGPFRKFFTNVAVSVRIGWSVEKLLRNIPGVRCGVCNTIMTANICLELSERSIPAVWVIHEWWPKGMCQQELDRRSITYMTESTVDKALEVAHVAYICKALREVFARPGAKSSSTIIYNGVAPLPKSYFADVEKRLDAQVDALIAKGSTKPVVTFLCLGIVCPRKNQLWLVRLFQKFAAERRAKGNDDVRLLIVGARKERQYEIDYLEEIEAAIEADGDTDIVIEPVTSNVDKFYTQADVFLFASKNEVTPCVICEAMLRGIPVITSDIAGIPEQLAHGVHGFVLPLNEAAFLSSMTSLADSPALRRQMGQQCMHRAKRQHISKVMVGGYKKLMRSVVKRRVLVDMDGVLVDWDRGFLDAWGDRSPVDRSDYYMERCVPAACHEAAEKLFCSKGFFRNLPPMEGGIAALREMVASGFDVSICTSPIIQSRYCAQEKWEWVREHLGDAFLPRLILTCDKTAVMGDVLIDDKPKVTGKSIPSWSHIIFDAPYNRQEVADGRVRMMNWASWQSALEEAATNEADKEYAARQKSMDTSMLEAKRETRPIPNSTSNLSLASMVSDIASDSEEDEREAAQEADPEDDVLMI